MNKFEKQLGICTIVVYENLKIHREALDKLTSESGIIAPRLKSNLTRAINLLRAVYDNYKEFKFVQQDANKLIKSIYEYADLRNAKNKDEKAFNYDNEKKLLPPQFLDSITTSITTFEYCYEKLKLTLEKTKAIHVFDKMQNNLKKYTDFLIEEVILYVFMESELREWKDKVLAGELYHNRDRNLDEVFYYCINGKFTFRVARKNKTIFIAEDSEIIKLEKQVERYYKNNDVKIEGLGWS